MLAGTPLSGHTASVFQTVSKKVDCRMLSLLEPMEPNLISQIQTLAQEVGEAIAN